VSSADEYRRRQAERRRTIEASRRPTAGRRTPTRPVAPRTASPRVGPTRRRAPAAVTSPDDAAGLDEELDELLSAHDLAGRLVDVIEFELFDPARVLFGDRAVPWIASTLRATAAMLERLPTDRP
jgi:hypothetical protein